ncbi:hypothetical protein DY138_04040 [Apilactobacillus timberlakei]|uniref:Uncharacterized protein n=1 Tax=Apilactobacillus timberlakei TaxID=2008380 RepID=A0ABY2YZP5_9LACO|nr:hypothetical protein DYZ97_00915 [Apilactobacillus timberlakei]TPR15693.1 hypothetical protein DY052_03700 [Apilactobacillus timberlakei]TPR16054.1 hypothetical protein DY048_00915 [Apilactobacillus timberlakei]TPR18258.1 hypothetical protein DYZ95_02865 [Apilactobacillus timberlakei]TPR18795.1 hypothetical protein DY138_04040 [Apilactobacillus timberlakei]
MPKQKLLVGSYLLGHGLIDHGLSQENISCGALSTIETENEKNIKFGFFCTSVTTFMQRNPFCFQLAEIERINSIEGHVYYDETNNKAKY